MSSPSSFSISLKLNLRQVLKLCSLAVYGCSLVTFVQGVKSGSPSASPAPSLETPTSNCSFKSINEETDDEDGNSVVGEEEHVGLPAATSVQGGILSPVAANITREATTLLSRRRLLEDHACPSPLILPRYDSKSSLPELDYSNGVVEIALENGNVKVVGVSITNKLGMVPYFQNNDAAASTWLDTEQQQLLKEYFINSAERTPGNEKDYQQIFTKLDNEILNTGRRRTLWTGSRSWVDMAVYDL